MPPATHCIMLSCSDVPPVPAGTGGVSEAAATVLGAAGIGTGCPCAIRTRRPFIGPKPNFLNNYFFFA